MRSSTTTGVLGFRNGNVKSPQAFRDLPFASELAAFDASSPLEFDGDYDRVLFAGLAFADADAGGARFTECAFTDGTGFDGGQLRRARLSDVWFSQVRLVADAGAVSGVHARQHRLHPREL